MRRLGLAFAAALIAILFAATADAKVLISVDKSTQQMTVSVDGVTQWIWPVSTGRRGHATPVGSFQTFRMEEDHYSKEWDDAPMPHSIFFTKRGHAIHGSLDTRRLGMPASAGCVRLHPDHARELFALVKQQGVLNATVVIAGEEPRAPPAVAKQTVPPQRQVYRQPYPSQTYQAPPQGYVQPRGYAQPPQGYAQQPVYPPQGYRAPARGYAPPPSGYYYVPPPPGYRYAPPPPGYTYAQPPAGYYYYR